MCSEDEFQNFNFDFQKMSRGRDSLSASDHLSDVTEAYSTCNLCIENLAIILKSDLCKIFDSKQIEVWSDSILKLSELSCTKQNLLTTTERYIDNILKRRVDNDSENSDTTSSTNTESRIKRMKLEITNSIVKTNKSDQFMRRVEDILGVRKNQDDEDVVMMSTGDVENDFICPFTSVRMQTPMKKYTYIYLLYTPPNTLIYFILL